MKNKKIFPVIAKYLFFIVIGMAIFISLSIFAQKQTCPTWETAWSQGGQYYTYPDKVIIEPWKGDHNIYGIFQIPIGYTQRRVFTVQIPDLGTYCGFFTDLQSNANIGIQAKPGHYLVKGFFRTRIALPIILVGKLSELKKTTNWQVGYLQKEENKGV